MKEQTTDQQNEKNIVAVEEALSKSEQFIERNQNLIIGAVVAIVLLIGGYIGYTRLVIEPKEREAQSEMFMAEKFFEQEDFEKALEGDGANLGFLDIINGYKMTKSANLARYYAGISYLNLGEYQLAIDYLQKFRGRDQMISNMAIGAIGDAYLQLDNKEEAAKYYMRAAENNPNQFTSPVFLLKAGQVYESIGKYDQAVKAYETIKKEYREATEARNIERYIQRAKSAKS